jgi:hypothetical protein
MRVPNANTSAVAAPTAIRTVVSLAASSIIVFHLPTEDETERSSVTSSRRLGFHC